MTGRFDNDPGVDAAIKRVYNAWTIAGREPVYHKLQKRQLKAKWPVLYESLIMLERECNNVRR